MITRTLVVLLGLSQIISWGTTYYLIGVFGEPMVRELGWSPQVVYGGFSFGLLVMGLASSWIGGMVDRHGGRWVMTGGAVVAAIGCTMLALTHSIALYFTAWGILGLAMRATLYDAAFAALVRIGGKDARGPIAHITLLGGLASTCFWPLGGLLAAWFGWRGAVLCYAAISIAAIPLYLAIPARPSRAVAAGLVPSSEVARPLHRAGRRNEILAAGLFAFIVAVANTLNAGLSAHMIALLTDLGVGAAVAVTVSSLRGVGQSAARLLAVMFGRNLSPIDLNLIATVALPVAFALALAAAYSVIAAAAFAILYGAGNGLLSITRGTVPLTIFDSETYGRTVGRLLAPAFLFSAAAPTVFAWIVEHFGSEAALYFTGALGVAALGGAVLLKLVAAPAE
jgi:MFS family permease